MKREQIVSIHLYLAAFFAPVIIFIGISGGLYLLGQKGWTEKETLYEGEVVGFDIDAKNMETEIRTFIKTHSIDHDFEYVKGGNMTYFTRPTSKTHLVFQVKDDKLKVIQQKPNIIRSMVELHKGHGPDAFKTLQKVTAFGLIFIILSGVIVGFLSPKFRRITTIAASLGALVSLLLAVI